ncbi:MAG: bifunctional aspartate kinase/homoserine dehydrogenase I [Xanthomonadales bacterium]|nr:bifunctional aspartate kinase/homoserine dehydrogenase I [Xanthomonadales bacterium]
MPPSPESPEHRVAAAAPHCHVHKFGGSSVATARRLLAIRELVGDGSARTAVVVSALRGVTDALVGLIDVARTGAAWRDPLAALLARHHQVADEFGLRDPTALHHAIDDAFAPLDGWLRDIAKGADDPALDAQIHGLGEAGSSLLLHVLLSGKDAGWRRLDAREVLVVHQGELGAVVDWDASRCRFADWDAEQPGAPLVITGYVASDEAGQPTTLGRNGGDYSGAIFAVLLGADQLTIWTDVEGVLSADPRQVRDAVCLPALSYREACELAYFGATVLHPQSIAPAMQQGIPIRIRSALRPDNEGTLISVGDGIDGERHPVKGLSLVERHALLELSGTGLAGVPGTAERLFAALHAAQVSVTMISQGSSEHSICCVIRDDQHVIARDVVQKAFAEEIASGQVAGVSVSSDISVLAAVGDGMAGRPGVAARLLGGLAQARVNVRAIAQGAGERNISVAIQRGDAQRGLRAAHAAFWLSPQSMSVGLIGPGNVGRALLGQLAAFDARRAARPREGLRLRLRAIANSRRMSRDERTWSDIGHDFDPRAALADSEALDLDALTDHVDDEHTPHALIIDCSGSDAVAARYADWLRRGIHVVTPNKHAGSGALDRYREIRAASQGGGQFRYEATVGAGLPVIQTLRSLLDTGDELIAIDGLFSGTLAWLFNCFDGSRPFSELLLKARSMGYTEPDPREDLSGMDVARKTVILAREAGIDMELGKVHIENLVPEALRDLPLGDFLARAGELDAPMAARLQAAQAGGGKLRYLAELDREGNARVGLTSPPADHPSLHGRLTDNLIQFRTQRYPDNPLVVQGPGAGPDVTAAGVFSDILAIGQSLGARA